MLKLQKNWDMVTPQQTVVPVGQFGKLPYVKPHLQINAELLLCGSVVEIDLTTERLRSSNNHPLQVLPRQQPAILRALQERPRVRLDTLPVQSP